MLILISLQYCIQTCQKKFHCKYFCIFCFLFSPSNKWTLIIMTFCFQVYLIENKEESLMRAKTRIDKLNLSNVTLFQVYFGLSLYIWKLSLFNSFCGTKNFVEVKRLSWNNNDYMISRFQICVAPHLTSENVSVILLTLDDSSEF